MIPTSLAPGELADVRVNVEDPDSQDVRVVWRATSGDFTNYVATRTRYVCGDPGSQTLTVKARDEEGCERELELEVTCREE